MKQKRAQQVSNKDYEIVVSLLQKTEKQQRDLETIYNKISLLNGFNMFIQNYFQGSDVSEQIKICGELVYEKKNKGEIIFMQDEPSNNKLYIILKGSCMVFLKKDLDFQDEEQQQQSNQAQQQPPSLKHIVEVEEKEMKKLSNSILEKLKKIGQKYKKQISLDFDKKNFTQNEVIEFKKRYGKTTRLLEAGSIFGERALLTNQPRTATIVAESHPTELVILDRDKFLPALEELKRTLQLRRDILFQIFKDMDNYSSARLESMLYTFQVQSYNRGHYITEQDQKDDKLYIIADGEAQIMKKINIQINENHSEERFAKLTIIGPGVMVGDEIMLNSDTKYIYTTEVISIKAQVLVADKKIIDRKFPKDLRDYLKKISANKEKGRKVLLENKSQDLKEEIIAQMSRDQNKKFIQSQNYKDRTEEETNEMLKKFKESLKERSSISQKVSSPYLQAQQTQNSPQITEISLQQSQMLRGSFQLNREKNNSFLLPQINEKTNEEGNPNNSQVMKNTQQSQLNQANNKIFDVKSLVFDFGDGKNIQNAQRIEKILKAKNSKQSHLFGGNTPNGQKRNSNQVNQNNNNEIRQKSDSRAQQVMDLTEIPNGSSQTSSHQLATHNSQFFSQNNIQTIQNNQSLVMNKQLKQNNLSYQQINSSLVQYDQDNNTQSSIVFDKNYVKSPECFKLDGTYSAKHSRVKSEFSLGNDSLSLVIQNTGNRSTIFGQNKNQKETKQLGIIHSSKSKQQKDGEDTKLIRKPLFKVQVNSSTKLTTSLKQDTFIQGNPFVTPNKSQRVQLEPIEKTIQIKKNLMTQIFPEQDRKQFSNKYDQKQIQSLAILNTYEDNDKNTSETHLSVKVKSTVDQLDSDRHSKYQHLSEITTNYKHVTIFESTANNKIATKQVNSQHFNQSEQEKQSIQNIQEQLNEKIKDIDNLNECYQDQPIIHINVVQDTQPAETVVVEDTQDVQLKTPIKSTEQIHQSGQQSKYQSTVKNSKFIQVAIRNNDGFFPHTLSKPFKTMNNIRAKSLKQLSMIKDTQKGFYVNGQKSINGYNTTNKFITQNDMQSTHAYNNQTGQQFNYTKQNQTNSLIFKEPAKQLQSQKS